VVTWVGLLKKLATTATNETSMVVVKMVENGWKMHNEEGGCQKLERDNFWKKNRHQWTLGPLRKHGIVLGFRYHLEIKRYGVI